MKQILVIFSLFLTLAFFSCTKLKENFRSELEATTTGNVTAAQLLITVYNNFNGPLQTNGQFWALSQHTSDETLGPTRGPDWDDGGVWRVLHSHQWNADHNEIRSAFQNLLQAQFNASTVLQNNPSAQEAAEARFLRAFSMFLIADGWNQVPFRENLTDFRIAPKTLSGTEAVDFIISELNAVINNLQDGPAYVANKNAARVLMMKALLNKGAFANRQAPTFAAADMNQVIALADQVISSNKYSLANNYFDNFAPNNDAISTENIFTLYNKPGVRGGDVRARWFQILHYNQKPSGWNGFATLSDFYDKFQAGDTRLGVNYPGQKNFSGSPTGNTVGFFIGQQYNETGTALQDRKGNPLTFSRDVKLKETDPNTLERTGIRINKFPIDYITSPNGDASPSENDYPIFRLADVYLMKAEAILRGGTATAVAPTSPAALVNAIRTKRGTTSLTTVDLNTILDERGRELYWEGWRRQDLIRFGKYLQAWQEKPADDGPRRLLFPIPSNQLAVNPNLQQNPGY
ncbi:MAG: RagB/SusD family nutrient uptake outer membrane protein [Flavisolibacter sp.]|nr:RagB/SusD family nutrient uptake outer membrane protein [Flavisolibacter sp.]